MAAMAVIEIRSFLIAALPVNLGRHFAREKAATACPTKNFMELLILNKGEESKRRAAPLSYEESSCFPIRNMTMRKGRDRAFRPPVDARVRQDRAEARGLHRAPWPDPRARSDQGLRGHGRRRVLAW